MAKMIDYVPLAPDKIGKKTSRLEAEMTEHADAVLAALAVLEEAHRKQLLDLLRGAIGAKSTIFSVIADLGCEATSVNAARNLIVLAKTLGAIDPDVVSRASTNIGAALADGCKKNHVPSIWQLLKQADRPDVRRGISLVLEMAGALGRSVE